MRHGVWRGLEGEAWGVVWAGGRGTRCGGPRRAWHGVWVGLEGVAQGVSEAAGRGKKSEAGVERMKEDDERSVL